MTRSLSPAVLLLLATSISGAQTQDRQISLNGGISFGAASDLVAQVTQNNLPSGYGGSYRPIAPQPQQAPCGGFGTPPCTGAVLPNAGPTAESLYLAAKQASARGQREQSIDYLTRSARMGYRAAEYALGTDYQNGNGVLKDLQQAKYWLTRAALQGSPPAQAQLRQIDPANATKYLEMGAAKNDPQSDFDLAVAYELGHGVPHDRARAIGYFRLASRYGGNSTGDRIAAVLARTDASRRFGSEQALTALAPPPKEARARGVPANCPAWYDSTHSGTASSMLNYSRSFCIVHPNCTFHMDNQTFQCNGDETPLRYR